MAETYDLRKIKPLSFIFFYSLLCVGFLLWIFFNFITVRFITLSVIRFELLFFGFPNSTFEFVSGDFYLFPNSTVWTFSLLVKKGCTPSAGIFPLISLFAVPKVTFKKRTATYFLFVLILFFGLGFAQSVEIYLGFNGLDWEIAHNRTTNYLILTVVGVLLFLLLCKLLPYLPIMFFAPFIYLIVYVKRFIKNQNQIGT